MRSWSKKAILLLMAILAAAGIFLGWTSYNYAYAIRKTVTEENLASARLWRNQLYSRTSAVYEHIYELLLTLYSETPLLSGTPGMDISTKTMVLNMMQDKLLVSSDVDAFFIIDSQDALYLLSARSSLPFSETFHIKDFVRADASSKAKPFGNKSWDLVSIDGKDYLFKAVRLGKYTVGAISGCAHFSIEQSFNILGEEFACFLRTSEGLFSCGGDPALAPLLGNSPTSSYANGWITQVSSVYGLEGDMILLSRPGTMSESSDRISAFLFLVSMVCVTLILLLLFLLRRDVVRPSRELEEANQALASGQIDFRLDPKTAGSTEFQSLYESFNRMADQILKLRIDAYDMKLKDEENRLIMLRAQIKPHFLLNVITTISNMTYTSQPEEIRAYISVFARFVRYMLNTASPWTTVGEELSHISNYLDMQHIRFPGCVRYTVDCEESIAGHPIPFLCLFTLVENTTKHAMTLYEPLDIRIFGRGRKEPGFSGVVLRVEDSGGGFSAEALEKLREESGQGLYAKEHLGLNNVRYTLNLVYRRDDLLRVGNRPEGGAWVELWIPDEEVTCDETADL